MSWNALLKLILSVLSTLATVAGVLTPTSPDDAEPVPSPPSAVTLVADQSVFAAGESVQLTATTDVSVDGSGMSIRILDQVTEAEVASCNAGSTCVAQVSFSTGGPHSYLATAGDVSSAQVSLSRMPWTVSLTSNKSILAAGEKAALTATANQDVGESDGAYQLSVFDTTAGKRIGACSSGATCVIDSDEFYLDDRVGHDFVAAVTAAGYPATPAEAEDVQATSEPVSVTRAPWEVQLAIDPTSADLGDTVTLTATTNQDIGATHGSLATYIFDMVSGELVEKCTSGAECEASYTWHSATYAAAFMAYVATDAAPATFDDLEGIEAVSDYASLDVPSWEISLSADKSVLAAGESVIVTATVNQDVGLTDGNLAIYIVEWVNDRIVGVCTTGSVCTVTDRFNLLTDDSYADHDYGAAVAGYVPGATSTDVYNYDTRVGSNSVRVDQLDWVTDMDLTGFPGGLAQFTVQMNQDVGNTDGQFALLLFNSDDDSYQDSCVSGTRCILVAQTPSAIGYYVAIGRRTDPATGPDVVDWHAGDGVSWAPPQPSEELSGFQPVLGPMLRYEGVGGKNPSQNPCQCSHSDPVNTLTGEFYESVTDLAIDGAGPALAVTRSYSTSRIAEDGAFGFGWSTGWDGHLNFVIPGDESNPLPRQVEVVQENGSTVLFTRGAGSSTAYQALGRVRGALSFDTASSTWIYVRQTAQVLKFDSSGLLTALEDLDGNAVTISYSAGKPSQLTASGGRELYLTWDGTHVIGVADSAGRTVNYGYDSAGDLVSVTAVDGAETSYGYDDAHYITSVVKPGGGTTTNQYDGSHRAVEQVDPLGRATTFSFSGSGDAGDMTTTITAPDGSQTVEVYSAGLLVSQTVAVGAAAEATTTYVYDSGLNLVSQTDPTGATTNYTYDDAGNALTQTDALGRTTTRTFGAFHNPILTIDPLGRQSEAGYDAHGHVVSSVSAAGREQAWTYNSDGTIATFTDGSDATTSYGYDAAGRLSTTTDAAGRVTAIGYSSTGFATSTTTPDGQTATVAFDPAGRILSVTDPAGAVAAYTYNADGNQIGATDPNGATTTKTYDAAGQLASVTDANGGTTSYTYTSRGDVAAITNPLGQVTTNQYDARGQLVSVADPLGRVTAFAYDLAGRRTATTLPSGASQSSTYDVVGQLLTTTDPDGSVTTFDYDSAGQLVSGSDALGRTVGKAYNDDGQLVTLALADGSSQAYGYDGAGRLASFTNADGKESAYTYTPAGQPATRAESGGLVTSYAYDAGGRVSTATRADGSTASYQYDAAGRVVAVDYGDSSAVDVAFAYDTAGRLVGTTDASGASSYSYDAVGNLVSETDGGGAVVGYGYDAANRVTSLTYPGGDAVTYDYDAAGQMTSLKDWLDRATTFEWTADGRLAGQGSPNGVTATRTYDPAGQLTGVDYDTGGPAFAAFRYQYDAGGQLSASTVANGTTVGEEYGYDPLGQLASLASTPLAGATQSSTLSATSAGLLTTNAAGDVLSYNSAQQPTELTPESGPLVQFGYDDNGSRSSRTVAGVTPQVTEYRYSASMALAGVTTPDVVVDYVADASGLRQSRTANGVLRQFVWSTAGDLPLLLSDGDHRYLYGPTPSPIVQVDLATGDTEYLHPDLLGSPRVLTDASGAVVGRTDFDAFGERREHSGVADSAIGFTGNWTDPDTGLVYLRARDYDPATGQFLTVDPALDATHQPYAYASNNPLLFTDHTGLDFWGDLWGNAGALGAGLLNGVTFGLSGLIMSAVVPDYDCFVETHSGFYTAGDIVGTVASTVAVTALTAGGGTGLAVGGVAAKVAVRSATKAAISGVKATASTLTRSTARASERVLAEQISVGRASSAAANRTRAVVIGEDMEGRVIPYSKKIGSGWYQPDPGARPEAWMKNNRDWINDQMDRGCIIIDCGAAPGRANFPGPSSPYYEMELGEISRRNYNNYISKEID